MKPLALAQRHLILGWAVVTAVTLITAKVTPLGTAMGFLLAGVAVAWVASGRWAKRERWSVRAQTSVIGLLIGQVITSERTADVATVGLYVFLAALLFLNLIHIVTMKLAIVGTANPARYIRAYAIRQSLFAASFVAPATVVFAPNIWGALFIVAVCGVGVTNVAGHIAGKRLRRYGVSV